MKYRSFVALLTMALALFVTATPATAQSSDSDSAATAPEHSKTTTITIRCDTGKTTVVQNTFVSDTGVTSRVIAITTGAGNLYTVAYIEQKPVAQTIKGVRAKDPEPIDMGSLLFLVEVESPNYMLLARRRPNDCELVK